MDNPSMDSLDMDLAHATEEIQRWQRAAEANIGENVRLRHEKDEGWKEAAIAWEVCASIHEKWAKGKDALYSTRHADFVKHAADARAKLTPNDRVEGRDAALSRRVPSHDGLAGKT